MNNTIDSVDGRTMGANPQELIDQISSSYGYNPPQPHIHLHPPACFPVYSPAGFLVNSLAGFLVNSPAPFPVYSPAGFLVNSPAPFPVYSPAGFLVNSPAPFPFYSPAPFPFYSPAGFPSPPTFPVVRLGRVPWDAREQDVVNFFRGLHIIDTLFVYDNGRFTGDAFCLFTHPAAVEYAIQKNGQKMGQNCVDVYRSKRHDYYLEVEKRFVNQRKNSTKHTGVLRLLGLPNSVDRKEIVDFFRDFMLAENSVYFTLNSDGQQIGEAFVEFNNAGASRAAMEKDRKMLRDHYICLVPSSYEDLERAIPDWR